VLATEEVIVGPQIEIPDELGTQLLSTAGISQWDVDNSGFALTAIELDALGLTGTACGTVGNAPFKLGVLNMLAAAGVEFVVAVLDKQLRICSMAAKLSAEDAEKLSDMIEENGGSLRADTGPDNWVTFESE